MGMRIPSVRDAVQPAKGPDGETLPPLPYPFGCSEPTSPTPYMLPLLLIYRATSKGSAGVVDIPRGAPPAFSVDEGGRPSRRWGVDLRAGGQRQGTGRDSRILSAPAAVPARRGGRSGATASPFRRDGIAVPARPGRPLAQKANSDGRQKATLTLRPAASHDPPATLRASKYHLSSPRVGAAVPCRPRAAACLRRAKCVVSA